jgi:uncharacterized membrane protein
MFILQKYTQEKYIHRLFVVTLVLKGINSVLEIVGGLSFLFLSGLTEAVTAMVRNELIEDPTDFVATQIQHVLPYFSTHSQLYASFYLLSHGIVKIVLVISLLCNRLWAYPATIVTLVIFIAYQLYRLAYGYSLPLILLTVLDILLIILTWHEYKIIRTHPRFAGQNNQ